MCLWFAAYIAADAILIYAPIQFIWGTRFPQTIKIRLIAVFAATLITTAMSFYYIYTLLKVRGIAEDFAAVIQVSPVAQTWPHHMLNMSNFNSTFYHDNTVQDDLSLIVANLSVITSFIFALLSPASCDDDAEALHPWHAPRLTPARSFPFISTIKSLHRGEGTASATHVNLRVEVERDFQIKPILPQSVSKSEHGIEQCGVQDGRLELGEKEGEREDGGGRDVL